MKLRQFDLQHREHECWIWTFDHDGHTWTDRLRHHYGNSRCVMWKENAWVLGMGSTDWYIAARDLDDPETLYVLTGNYALGYLGLERLHPDHSTPHSTEHEYSVGDSVFFQDPDDAWSGSPQPKPWHEYAWHTQIRRLAEYL